MGLRFAAFKIKNSSQIALPDINRILERFAKWLFLNVKMVLVINLSVCRKNLHSVLQKPPDFRGVFLSCCFIRVKWFRHNGCILFATVTCESRLKQLLNLN